MQDKEPNAGYVKTLIPILITLWAVARVTFWSQIQQNQDKSMLIKKSIDTLF